MCASDWLLPFSCFPMTFERSPCPLLMMLEKSFYSSNFPVANTEEERHRSSSAALFYSLSQNRCAQVAIPPLPSPPLPFNCPLPLPEKQLVQKGGGCSNIVLNRDRILIFLLPSKLTGFLHQKLLKKCSISQTWHTYAMLSPSVEAASSNYFFLYR